MGGVWFEQIAVHLGVGCLDHLFARGGPGDQQPRCMFETIFRADSPPHLDAAQFGKVAIGKSQSIWYSFGLVVRSVVVVWCSFRIPGCRNRSHRRRVEFWILSATTTPQCTNSALAAATLARDEEPTRFAPRSEPKGQACNPGIPLLACAAQVAAPEIFIVAQLFHGQGSLIRPGVGHIIGGSFYRSGCGPNGFRYPLRDIGVQTL